MGDLRNPTCNKKENTNSEADGGYDVLKTILKSTFNEQVDTICKVPTYLRDDCVSHEVSSVKRSKFDKSK